jgi:hypothetical protein
VKHYEESLQDARADKLTRDWVKPLTVIVKTLGGDVKSNTETKGKKMTTNTEEKAPKAAPKKPAQKPAVKKATAVKKPAAVKATKPKTDKPAAEGKPTIASQVRALIGVHKAKGVTAPAMVEIVIQELGLTKQRGKSVVKAFFEKVEA